ncbi:shikimate dehydrogenase [Sphingomonas sp. LHG3406-1]|uniref:shikimate dehydrogenase family protein n=1 Tax=Sphingomonas sp. LHG3406-1 TaxID=2804617 RepID=UPI00261307A1|nr:shikimate dehydrogenase [Sphingomonas sp. LHG3406-1]
MIGDPVGHSRSPLIHRFWLGKLGLAYDYRATRVTAGDLPHYLEQRRSDPLWCGCNVTMPLKVEALRYLDEQSAEVGLVGAANTITRVGAEGRLSGHNTDLNGVSDPLRPWIEGDRISSATVIGTGGAAAAAMVALLRRPAPLHVTSVGRTKERALAFRRRFDPVDAEYASVEVGDLAQSRSKEQHLSLLVNASPLGMRGHPPLQVDLGGMAPGSVVFDMVYDPLETDLLRQARERGLVAVGGLTMLVAQAAAAFAHLFGEEAPRDHDAELRELLTA